jgi:hypothetical protein
MIATTYFASANQAARHGRGARASRHCDGVHTAPARGFMRLAQTAGVDHRSLAPTLSRYPKMTGFTEANNG